MFTAVWYIRDVCYVRIVDGFGHDQLLCLFFFQAEDGIRDLVRSRGLGDVYKRQIRCSGHAMSVSIADAILGGLKRD